MKRKTHALATMLALAAIAVAATASATQAGAKPAFPAGTWTGTGVLATETETVAGLTTRTSGSATFTLKVSKAGRVTGKGSWKVTQIGTGSVSSKITGVANVSFSGTRANVRFEGTEVVTTKFWDATLETGNTFTRKEPYRGSLVIKKVGRCLVTGGHTFDGGTFGWKAKPLGCR